MFCINLLIYYVGLSQRGEYYCYSRFKDEGSWVQRALVMCKSSPEQQRYLNTVLTLKCKLKLLPMFSIFKRSQSEWARTVPSEGEWGSHTGSHTVKTSVFNQVPKLERKLGQLHALWWLHEMESCVWYMGIKERGLVTGLTLLDYSKLRVGEQLP